mmetsp:Transcript_93537/g.168949  ORF Transcript_93537/g.168949 Transcript_93537/m.168949 type:complete len:214 (+) Transcript_93537:458-1099(+)
MKQCHVTAQLQPLLDLLPNTRPCPLPILDKTCICQNCTDRRRQGSVLGIWENPCDHRTGSHHLAVPMPQKLMLLGRPGEPSTVDVVVARSFATKLIHVLHARRGRSLDLSPVDNSFNHAGTSSDLFEGVIVAHPIQEGAAAHSHKDRRALLANVAARHILSGLCPKLPLTIHAIKVGWQVVRVAPLADLARNKPSEHRQSRNAVAHNGQVERS